MLPVRRPRLIAVDSNVDADDEDVAHEVNALYVYSPSTQTWVRDILPNLEADYTQFVISTTRNIAASVGDTSIQTLVLDDLGTI